MLFKKKKCKECGEKMKLNTLGICYNCGIGEDDVSGVVSGINSCGVDDWMHDDGELIRLGLAIFADRNNLYFTGHG